MDKKTKKLLLIFGGLGFLGLCGIVAIFFGIVSLMTSSDAYELSIKSIEESEDIRSIVGDIEGYGFMPSGSISTSNGLGDADFTISVDGSKKDLKVRTILVKELNSDWELVDMQY